MHIGIPEELESYPLESIPNVSVDRLRGNYITVGEIAKNIGWKI